MHEISPFYSILITIHGHGLIRKSFSSKKHSFKSIRNSLLTKYNSKSPKCSLTLSTLILDLWKSIPPTNPYDLPPVSPAALKVGVVLFIQFLAVALTLFISATNLQSPPSLALSHILHLTDLHTLQAHDPRRLPCATPGLTGGVTEAQVVHKDNKITVISSIHFFN